MDNIIQVYKNVHIFTKIHEKSIPLLKQDSGICMLKMNGLYHSTKYCIIKRDLYTHDRNVP